MKINEVRMPFRILAGVFALPLWLMGILSILFCIADPLNMSNWVLLASSVSLALTFSYACIKGVVPKYLIHIFSYGPVGGKDDFK